MRKGFQTWHRQLERADELGDGQPPISRYLTLLWLIDLNRSLKSELTNIYALDLAGERDDLRSVAQDRRAQTFPVEVVIAELRIDAGHGLDKIGQAEAKGEDLAELLRLQAAQRQPAKSWS